MLRKICHYLFFNILGWRDLITVPTRDKCIICVAPHTSNWDFILGEIYYTAIGKHSNFLMKKEWFFWPVGLLLRKMGGVPVFRSKKASLTEQLAVIAQKESKFQLAITPEGTRSLNANWKKGFYFIALKAEIPIQLYAIDYKEKKVVCTKEIIPCGDFNADMRLIKDYYKDYKGKYPHKFTTGES